MAIAPDTVHGEQELDFGEGDRVYGREAVCFRGSASMGNRPRGGGGSTGRGMEQPPPLSPVSHRRRLSMRAVDQPPASLSHLLSMPSRKKPHHAAVARGIPHEDGGCIFIQIPVTPPESVHGLDTERFIKPVRHWFDGLRQSLVRGLMFYYIAVRCIWVDKARVAKPGQRRQVEGLVS